MTGRIRVNEESVPFRRPGGLLVWSRRVLMTAAAAALLWLAFRSVPLAAIGSAIALIRPWQIAVILGVNILFHAMMGLRWWFLSKTDIGAVRLLDMIIVRLSAFGVSYFTPGPQLGGEPVQIIFLRRRHGATLARAAATVIMDRLIELLAGFVFMLAGVGALLHEGLLRSFSGLSPALAVPLGLVASWPLVHIILLGRGLYPVSRIVDLLPEPRFLRKMWRVVRAAEHLAGRFCQRQPEAVRAGLAASLVAPALSVMEYALITSFLGMDLSPWQVIAGWTAGWLSFLVPLPGAVGALEGSQIIALGSFGVQPAIALGAALVLRARDLVFGGVGFFLAARLLQARSPVQPQPADAL